MQDLQYNKIFCDFQIIEVQLLIYKLKQGNKYSI